MLTLQSQKREKQQESIIRQIVGVSRCGMSASRKFGIWEISKWRSIYR